MKKVELIENKGSHYYDTEIGRLPSSTTILSILRKPAIEVWMVKTTCEYLGSRLPDIKSGKLQLSGKNAYRLLQEAKNEHNRIKDEAAQIGTAVHKLIEIYLNDFEDCESFFTNHVSKLDKEAVDKVKISFEAFKKWQSKNQFEILETELAVYSKKGYAGTLDAVGYYGKNKKLFILDFKTSGGFWEPEYCMQVSSYRAAYQEMFHKRVQGMGILRLDKNTGMPHFKNYSNEMYRKYLKAFSNLVKYYHIVKSKRNVSEISSLNKGDR